MKSFRIQVGSILALVLGVSGLLCGAAPTTTAPAAIPVEYRDAGVAIENAVMASDGDAVTKLFDMDAMLTKATIGVPASKAFHDGFIMGYKKAGGIAEQLVPIHKNGGSYRMLRIFRKNGAMHGMFRVLTAQGSINYNDWTLVKQADGVIRGTDIYVAASGEELSATTRRIYLAAAAQNDTGFVARMLGADRAYIEHGKDVVELGTDFRAGKFEDALAVYDRMPDSLRKEKSFFILRVAALGRLRVTREAEYEAAMKEYAVVFAGDPSVELICLDGWFKEKAYASCYAALDHLEKWTGGDPMLSVYRATIMMQEGKPGALTSAEQLIRRAGEAEPRLIAPRMMLIQNLVAQQKYGDAVAVVREQERVLKQRLKIEASPALKELASSDAYKAYRAESPDDH